MMMMITQSPGHQTQASSTSQYGITSRWSSNNHITAMSMASLAHFIHTHASLVHQL